MRYLIFFFFLSALVLSGCSAGRYTTIADIPIASDLPVSEEVATVGLRAKQLWVSLSPKAAEYATKLDADQFTSIWTQIVFDFPLEAVVTQPHAYQLTAYSLAHQWGSTQIAIDYLRRLQEFIGDRTRELDGKQAGIAWANFFAAMTPMGYDLLSGYGQSYADRLANELAIARNRQSVQRHNLLSEYYSQEVNNTSMLKHKVTQLKEQLTAYAKLLDTYRGWLFEASKKLKKEMPADARRILERKALPVEM